MLKKGENSYVTAVEADRYVSARHFGNAPARMAWDALNGEGKNRLLVRACAMIESLLFPGRKADAQQSLSWPRGRTSAVPEGIRHAQIELALWLAPRASGEEQDVSRAELIAQGVTAYRIGDLSEDLDGSKALQGAMQCPEASLLLQPYLGGGYVIC